MKKHNYNRERVKKSQGTKLQILENFWGKIFLKSLEVKIKQKIKFRDPIAIKLRA